MWTVEISHVSKRFGPVVAVDDVSFQVGAGDIFGLLGPNGAGKTTTIRMMLDIFTPDSGTVSVFGGPWSEEKKERLGYLPEERGLYKDQTLDQVLPYLARLKGLSDREANERLKPWLRRFELEEHVHKKVDQLSRGMQQKAQLIAALVHEPDLLVVDEPFSGLDPVNTRLVKDIILEQAAAGKTVVMSTHQMHQVEALCDRIMLINHGRAVLDGHVAQIKRDLAGNAVIVGGSGEIPPLPGVLEVRRENADWRLTLAPGTDPQSVLLSLVQEGTMRIDHFELAEPSLEDIFVTVVQDGVPALGVADA